MLHLKKKKNKIKINLTKYQILLINYYFMQMSLIMTYTKTF